MSTAHVREFCSRLFFDDGQACVVISFVLPGERVACYDLDAARIFRLDVADVRALLTETDAEGRPVGRATDVSDFEYEAILSSHYADDAMEITCLLEEAAS